MNRHLRLLWLLLGLGSFAFLAVLFFLPTTWRVERRRDVAASPERIFAELVDLHRWAQWSPWREGDYPGLIFRYSGPASGPGAEVDWDSKATGDGRLRIARSESPRLLAVEMAFQGGQITAHDTLRLERLPGGATRLTWSDRGSLGRTLLGRLSLSLIEQSMGRDLERGLAQLAALVEAPAAPPAAPVAPTPSDVEPPAPPAP